MEATFARKCLAELAGTYILVFFGVGAVHTAVLFGAQHGLWQVAVVWGIAVAMAIYTVGSVSGAHLNPAITSAMALFRGFPARNIPGYVLSQLTGAFLAAATLYVLFGGIIHDFETTRQIVRGQPGSELSAMMYGEYFPNPGTVAACPWLKVSLGGAMLAEAIGTALLAFFIFAVTEPRHDGSPGPRLLPAAIGLTISILISIFAPLTQACFNPARDFGPRLFAWCVGWGSIAIPGPRGGFFAVYILAPVVGAIVGAAIYQFLVRPAPSQNGRE